MRWLKAAGGKGYRYGCMEKGEQLCASAEAFADDQILMTGCYKQMIIQAQKVVAYCDWTGMTLNPQKCELSAILYGTTRNPNGTQNKEHTKRATDWTLIEPILQKITICGQQAKLIPPTQTFQCLGLHITLSLCWKAQLQHAKQLIINKSKKNIACLATMKQKLQMEEDCVFSAIAYSFCVTPYTIANIIELDRLRP